jgi:hypothetical protein
MTKSTKFFTTSVFMLAFAFSMFAGSADFAHAGKKGSTGGGSISGLDLGSGR